MTDLITAEESQKMLDECDAETCLTCAYARTVVALHAELTLARADAKAAQALVLEEATKRLAAARETFCYASPGSDEEFTSLLLGFDTAAGIIRDLAPDAGTAELAKLRGERDALLDAVQANMLRPDYLRAERAEAERDRLAAELAAANAREAGAKNAAMLECVRIVAEERNRQEPGPLFRVLNEAMGKIEDARFATSPTDEVREAGLVAVDIVAIESGNRRWHGEDHRVVSVRWEPYKPDGARQMKAKGRWQEQVGSGDYWRWQNCDRPAALAQPSTEGGA